MVKQSFLHWIVNIYVENKGKKNRPDRDFNSVGSNG